MSLAQLRAVRLAGQRPESVIVIVGAADVADSPGVVVVEDETADLRPLLGLPVHVIDMQNESERFVRVLDALEALKVKQLGVCGALWSCGVSEEHERAMERYRESLCKF